MPTSSSGRPPDPHLARGVAESFGVDAPRYDRARPRYPDALVRRIVAASPGSEVLNVGCGTGIEARQLQQAGCTVLGVEPDPRMADFARRTGVEVEVATFEKWQAAGRTFDAVIAGTAWHWVDPVAGATKAARVLLTGGLLAPFWHVFQLPPLVAEAFAAAYRRVVPDSPVTFEPDKQGVDAYQPLLTRAADGMHEVGGFSTPEQLRFDWTQPYTRDELFDLMLTQGLLTRLAPDEQAAMLDGVGSAVDQAGGSVTMSGTTVAVVAVRTRRAAATAATSVK